MLMVNPSRNDTQLVIEIRLARGSADLLKKNFTLISNSNSVYQKIKGYYEALNKNEEIKV